MIVEQWDKLIFTLLPGVFALGFAAWSKRKRVRNLKKTSKQDRDESAGEA